MARTKARTDSVKTNGSCKNFCFVASEGHSKIVLASSENNNNVSYAERWAYQGKIHESEGCRVRDGRQ